MKEGFQPGLRLDRKALVGIGPTAQGGVRPTKPVTHTRNFAHTCRSGGGSSQPGPRLDRKARVGIGPTAQGGFRPTKPVTHVVPYLALEGGCLLRSLR